MSGKKNPGVIFFAMIIDYYIKKAVKMAILKDSMGVSSTYFTVDGDITVGDNTVIWICSRRNHQKPMYCT